MLKRRMTLVFFALVFLALGGCKTTGEPWPDRFFEREHNSP